MFPVASHNQAENGGGGNRTREKSPYIPRNHAELRYISGWNNLAELSQRNAIERTIAGRDGGRFCFYCGVSGEHNLLELDHVTPQAHGGSDSVENLVFACAACNWAKSSWPGWIFVLRSTGLCDLIRRARLANRDPEPGEQRKETVI